jgi:hypothetical protein
VTIDVGTWLRDLGLGRYEAAFRENEIDEKVLPKLTPEDLKEIGVGPVGHRRKLLAAIALLRADGGVKPPPPEDRPAFPKPAHTAKHPDQLSREAVGRRMQIFRLGLGKSQQVMAKQYGSVSDGGQAWYNYESGRRTFPIAIANKLTLQYGLDIGWIYQGRLDQLSPQLSEIIQRGEEELLANHPRGRLKRARPGKDQGA